MTHPDYRALCAELLEALDRQAASDPEADGGLLRHRARAALAQPEPEFTAEEVEMIQAPWSYLAPAQPEPVGPTDKELLGCMLKAAASVPGGQCTGILDWDKEAIAAARAVLARYGHPTPQPIPVSERLPGDQLCWWFESDEDGGYGSNWTLLRIRGSAFGYTHWLPAHALPLPSVEVAA